MSTRSPATAHAVPIQDAQVVAGVVRDLGDFAVGEGRLERRPHGFPRQAGRVDVSQRDVGRLVVLAAPRHRQPDNVGLLRVDAGGLGVERERRRGSQLLGDLHERGRRDDEEMGAG